MGLRPSVCHLDHGYAITAHKAQGATFDRAFVLGSDDAYREWGYTAMSRHRESATFYITEPNDFLNTEVRLVFGRDELIDLATRTIGTERRQELAIEAMKRDPDLSRLLPDLDGPRFDTPPRGPARDPIDRDLGMDRTDGFGPERDDGLDFGL